MLVNSAVVTGRQSTAGKVESAPHTDNRRPEHETAQIREILQARYQELTTEYEAAAAENHHLRLAEINDAAGDDSADSGSKVAEREAASSLLRSILDRREQYARALQRLEAGSYGHCEGCAKPIPVERLAIFPSATTCVSCKSFRERRTL